MFRARCRHLRGSRDGSTHATPAPNRSSIFGTSRGRALQPSPRGGRLVHELVKDRVFLRGAAKTFMEATIFRPTDACSHERRPCSPTRCGRDLVRAGQAQMPCPGCMLNPSPRPSPRQRPLLIQGTGHVRLRPEHAHTLAELAEDRLAVAPGPSNRATMRETPLQRK